MSTTPTGGKRRRPSEFLLPDGRKVVVALPEDAATLRQKFSSSPEIQTEVVLHGSAEHESYLRESLRHHEEKRAALRERHGPAFDEWEAIHAQLDIVNVQLEKLTDQTAQLNANFSKFGYDAHLRTYDGDESDGASRRGSAPLSRQSTTNDAMSTKSEWDERRGGATIKLFKRPVIKQYFHRGLLWRASEETQVMCFELFFDLLYGMFALAEDTSTDPRADVCP
jgi:hypothetical protein